MSGTTRSKSEAPPPGDTPLGPCNPGFNPKDEPTRPCAWLGNDLCYDTKLEACACLCPRNSQNSTCISGFDDGPNGRTKVSCR